jgi:hypothetical protein
VRRRLVGVLLSFVFPDTDSVSAGVEANRTQADSLPLYTSASKPSVRLSRIRTVRPILSILLFALSLTAAPALAQQIASSTSTSLSTNIFPSRCRNTRATPILPAIRATS